MLCCSLELAGKPGLQSRTVDYICRIRTGQNVVFLSDPYLLRVIKMINSLITSLAVEEENPLSPYSSSTNAGDYN